MRISKVYTKTGDGGRTRLAGGQEVAKNAIRVEAYGTVDELNSIIGLARVFNQDLVKRDEASAKLEGFLKWIQNKLFDVGGLLATPPGQVFTNMPTVTEKDVEQLERWIDQCQEDLAPLKEFLLPGGGKVSGFLHQARTVSRRAERMCVTLIHEESVPEHIIPFLNRLSDAFFVFARWIGHHTGEPEFLWDRSVPGK
ncbi:cob(I)yrinic acid a,c-diamide adenosyltransferase [Candidatus Nitronereus thalassa]|uniref:Corrinoid adenosyltransferase n=1 Tax=Candidatus Nitronereus thalassa TaxID=3020898 RepID=A0ABU3K4V0_9BACT|nr:cob(I)yrinic acid a,c-diamide adenosyltransferase [Candidatus Nitronereus thalassa]MDT7041416.1 cob(I)yrinic acid a,c-diamide adenosyltransferase [Candidatus Nitronereus thalassa]